jgi:hypothetical protein
MKRTIILSLAGILFLLTQGYAQYTDPLLQQMEQLGITENNFGYAPKGNWVRYPVPQDIPYKILSFDDLMAHPQHIYDYVRTMSLSVEDFLHPDYLKLNNHNSILKLGYYCGVLHVSEQFRAYNSSLWAEVSKEEPLLNAVKEIYTRTNTTWHYNRMNEAADYPLIEKDFRNALKGLAPEVQRVVAATLLNVYEAWRFQQIGMRNVDYAKANRVWRIRYLGETQFDGMDYFPDLEDCAKTIDINSIYYAGLKLMETGEWLADTLQKLKASKLKINWATQNLNIMTPVGRLVISATGNDLHRFTDLALHIDLGGDDSYFGQAGSTPSLQIPVNLTIDLEGNDKYVNDDEFAVSQGAAVFGAGVLIDMKGNDLYDSKRLSQGAAMLGIGVLADMEGNDTYKMWKDGQGAAYFGVGLAIDNKGDDNYYIWGEGQGYGGPGGVGTLINRTGNDIYKAEPDTAVVYCMDRWHSKNGQYNYTYSQGAGIGRRGDVTDGHSWAGGIGTIIDLQGDDSYVAGGWSQACGYWYGMGYLYDKSGNDTYKASHWSQSCGAHFCIAGFFDEGGNDKVVTWEKLGAGMGFGHDFTVALFYNKGGNDIYMLHDDGMGYAINKSQVFFIDTDGDDTYIRSGKAHNYGWNNFTASNPPGVEMMYHLYCDQICIFGDVKGTDKYLVKDFESGAEKADTLMQDGSEYFYPSTQEREKLKSNRYYGMGKDFNTGNWGEIEIFRDKMKCKYQEFK